jgi:hypothetical protein
VKRSGGIGAWIGHGLVALLLTALTQVGGVLYAVALIVRARWFAASSKPLAMLAALFIVSYGLAWAPIERLATFAGRTSLPCFENRTAPLVSSPIACALHRHYVRPELADVATSLARAVDRAYPGALTRTLDAGFPFLDGLPMLPHLSHGDGKKLDLAFYYARQSDGSYRRGVMRSPIGYWAFERPLPGETQPCAGREGAFRWEMAWFGVFTRDDLALDRERTRFALRWLATEGAENGIGKVFVEPHLRERLGISGSVIRFQGCRAARHDDHIHIQLR